MDLLPTDYFKALSEQLLFISTFLGGFSATMLTTLLVSNVEKTRTKTSIVIILSLASTFFILSVLSFSKLFLMLTPGTPMEVTNQSILVPRFIGSFSFLMGILSLIISIGLSGWLLSKKVGYITSVIGFFTLILIFIFLL